MQVNSLPEFLSQHYNVKYAFQVYLHSRHHSALRLCKRKVRTWLSVLCLTYTHLQPLAEVDCFCRLMPVTDRAISLVKYFILQDGALEKFTLIHVQTQIHGHVCNMICLKNLWTLKSSVFDLMGGVSISVFQWTKECFIWCICTENSLFLSWVSTRPCIKTHCHVSVSSTR